jgi:hypothetical protein
MAQSNSNRLAPPMIYALTVSSAIKVVTAPLERIRMLRQLQGQYLLEKSISRKLSTVEWFKTIINKEGYLSLFKGCLMEIIRGVPAQFLLKYSRIGLNSLKIFKVQPRKDSPTKKKIKMHLVGALSTAFSYIMAAPFDVLITRSAGTLPTTVNSVTTLDLIRDLFASPQNFLTCFNGIILYVFGIHIYRVLYPALLDNLSKRLGDKKWISYLSFILAAQVAYPFDTIRRRALISNGTDIIGISSARSIFSQEGLAGFFYGSELNAARIAISVTIVRLYEYIYEKYPH